MKRLLALLLLFLLLGACSDKVEVTIFTPADYVENGWDVYGVDTVWVTLHPYRDVYTLELLIDSVPVGVDTFPGPRSGFAWNVGQLPEAGVHRLQARAVSGSREYLSAVVLATVGYRSRLVMDGPGESLRVYRPDGTRVTSILPFAGATPISPRFARGCTSVVFVAQHKLYQVALSSGQVQAIDSVGNGIYGCDASPVSGLVAFEAYPSATAHLFTRDGPGARVQLTHDGDIAYIDSSPFTCTANSGPAFSPDGGRLAYYRESECLVSGDPHEGETRQDAFVMNRYGSSLVNLTPGLDNAHFSGFTWTFDGKWVLFREGLNATPDRVLAANLQGHTVVVTGLSPLAMACSPIDSALAYIGTEAEGLLHAVKLSWTEDTLYVNGPGSVLSDAAFHLYLDWVGYSGQ